MYHIVVYKVRSTWYWTTHNPQGGSFGSNHCGTLKATMCRAMRGIPEGASYYVTCNGRDNEPTVKGLA